MNKLINETSPYLLQHAHNPVHWYPWGEEALNKAREENKPILVSIGYSACHWCHVMERESFEDAATAQLMNENFINIKIDREERPDLDHIYMDAVQAMTGSGGWPLNVFLTPDKKPFFGGTYFPPQPAYNRASWQDTLLGVAQAFREKRHEIDAQAENLTAHLLQSNSFGIQKLPEQDILSATKINEAVQALLKSADKEWGGFGRAPKFPQTFSIQFLLRNSITKKPSPEGIGIALLSLDKMIEGGIYDQVGGGFSRYATDTEWLAPHFEKMLYDNALLVSTLSEAYLLTKRDRYKEVIEETIGFVQRELLHPDGGFYSALDADSEGVEGKFYTWSKKEVEELLGDDAEIFCAYYDVTENGNWEHTNILRVKKVLAIFAIENGLTVEELKSIVEKGRNRLLAQREKRIRPSLDDKIILGWNALMNTALSKAFAATKQEQYRQLAVRNMNFLIDRFSTEQENDPIVIGFQHCWKNDKAKYPAFLDDYAYLIEAMLHLQEITADTVWLSKAGEITDYVISQFSEEGTGFFYYTPDGQDDIIIRKKEVYDGAVPSGNSVMAYNLWRLSILLDRSDWRQRSMDMLAALGNAITRHPSSFGYWASLLQEVVDGTNEIVIIGEGYGQLAEEILSCYIPHRVLMGASQENPKFPLLAAKTGMGEKVAIYLCRNYTCASPVFSAEGLTSLINKGQNR
jgi:uncharacterized protein